MNDNGGNVDYFAVAEREGKVQRALTLAREALSSAELCWLWDDDTSDWYMCCWSCTMVVAPKTSMPRHSPTCPRQLALSAIREVQG
jgi:hypothetical protein